MHRSVVALSSLYVEQITLDIVRGCAVMGSVILRVTRVDDIFCEPLRILLSIS